mgnify:CR=1 FL=1
MVEETQTHPVTPSHEGCQGHDETSTEPSNHACLCADHGDQGTITQAYQTVAPSLVIADVKWIYLDTFPINHATELYVYYHSPPTPLPLYLTQASLLI